MEQDNKVERECIRCDRDFWANENSSTRLCEFCQDEERQEHRSNNGNHRGPFGIPSDFPYVPGDPAW